MYDSLLIIVYNRRKSRSSNVNIILINVSMTTAGQSIVIHPARTRALKCHNNVHERFYVFRMGETSGGHNFKWGDTYRAHFI